MTNLLLWRCAAASILLLLTCSGCLAPLLTGSLPPGSSVIKIAGGLLPETPVALTSDGSLLALVRKDGLVLLSLEQGGEAKITSEIPVALAFNSQGSELVAAFVSVGGSRLQRYAIRDGQVLAEISFPGRCEALLSREGEWLVFVSHLEMFRFGGNMRSHLLRWDGMQIVKDVPLHETHLDRSTLAGQSRLLATIQPQLSPHGDEILFLRLQDPPAFDPYVAVVLRHLETGAERIVAKLPKIRGTATYLEGGDLVLYGDGAGLTTVVEPWQEKVVAHYPGPGSILAAPVSGDLAWMDDSLLRRNGQLLFRALREIQSVFFLSGQRLLLRENDRLWLFNGLQDESSLTSPPDSERILLLRKWRAEGLIEPQEFADLAGE